MFIIRNDDPAYDLDLDNYKWFCELCDKYGFKIIQAIVPIGRVQQIDSSWDNEHIVNTSGKYLLSDNETLLRYMQKRDDLIAVHGLWHTHQPTDNEIEASCSLLNWWGLKPTYFVPPFNEGSYEDKVCGLKVSAKTERLEDFHNEGKPTSEIVYLHSWRYDSWYKREDLEKCLARITTS